MKKKIFSLCTFILISLAGPLPAQDVVHGMLDDLLSGVDDSNEGELENLLELGSELLEYFRDRPNINDVPEEILQHLPFLTAFQLYSFLEYRERYGVIYSPIELQLIPAFHPDIREAFSWLFSFGPSGHEKEKKPQYLELPSRGRILVRSKFSFPLKAGFLEDEDTASAFHGAAIDRLVKMEFKHHSHYRFGASLESDAGEPIRIDSVQNGFDFQSAYLEIKDLWKTDHILLGDYRLAAGEGLLFSYGIKSKSFSNAFTPGLPLMRKYSSSSESGFYRGLSLSFSPGKNRIIAGIFSQYESATLHSTQENGDYFRSLNMNGKFRNNKERNKRKNIKSRGLSLIMSRSMKYLNLGVGIRYNQYHPSRGWYSMGDPYSSMNISKSLFRSSVFYQYYRKNIMLSGELAGLARGGLAFQQMFSAKLHPLFTLNMAFRYYSPRYFNPQGNGFSESSNLRNEQGFYAGLTTFPFNFLKLSGYIDIYRFPRVDYRSVFPVNGQDFTMKSTFFLHPLLDLKILFKTETRTKKKTLNETNTHTTTELNTWRFYLQYTWHINQIANTRFRTEFKGSRSGMQKSPGGLLIYQEFNFKIPTPDLGLNLRYQIFDCPLWEDRIYAWEHDLLYSFNSGMFYGTGSAWFINLRYNPLEKLKTGIKFRGLHYLSEQEKGSGPDKRKSSAFYDLKIQLILNF